MLDVKKQQTEPIPLRADGDGVIRLGDTRVSLLTLITAYQNGASAEVLVEKFPALSLPDVYAVITYYLRHRSEVDAHLAGERAEEAQITKEVEAEFPANGLRERLLKRLQAQQA